MIVNRKEHLDKSGIYLIRNTLNNKVYIGKSINIASRMYSHKRALRKNDSKSENAHFINAWNKYGEDAFEYIVLEYIDKNRIDFEEFSKERELFWINCYNSVDRNLGYNLRRDSATNMMVHPETAHKLSLRTGENNANFGNKWTEGQKKKASEKFKKMFKSGELKPISKESIEKAHLNKLKNWEENPESKEKFIENLSKAKTKYSIYQYDKVTKELINIWERVKDITLKNPNYKVHNIYAVCSGEKPSIYGYIWKKVLNDDIVHPI